MMDWLDLLRVLPASESVAMISVLATEGSAPRGAGTRMLVTAQGEHGTIGGGALEFRAIEQARAMLGQPAGTWRVQDYPLGPLLGQCCGGRVRLLIEHVDPAGLGWLGDAGEGRVLVSHLKLGTIERRVGDGPAMPISARGDRPQAGASLAEAIGIWRRPLYLFGAGHVGQAIARHVSGLPLRLAWFDTRPVFETIDGVAVVAESAIAQCVEQAPDHAAMVILTHDHGLDYRLTHAALARSPLAFTGLIGSKTKRARFMARLERDGIAAEARGRLTCPIGLPGVTGKEPDVIAVAVLAQLLQLPQLAQVQAVAA
ncbi:MAG: xanthine dehydrogenase accessory protein XdhC [Novosphingobium sp. 28-62-57]|nr:MAG: xanthine dehydrogenase accessory protein XdhC [Novosphingobium sp. 12-62-10]OYZ12115.1 MAG: xanthine dehydrogenase accessory protein XdhC [Novosphingobium sp. 28-62-57]OZA32070.1 MAG: xanthine dehydrogenase accessory protein XdhC [Novosphingobium sp. 17-62-9]